MTERDDRNRRAGSGRDRDHSIHALHGAALGLERACVASSGRSDGLSRVGLLQAIATVRLLADEIEHQDLRETGYWLADAAELFINASTPGEADAAMARVRERTDHLGELAGDLVAAIPPASAG